MTRFVNVYITSYTFEY